MNDLLDEEPETYNKHQQADFWKYEWFMRLESTFELLNSLKETFVGTPLNWFLLRFPKDSLVSCMGTAVERIEKQTKNRNYNFSALELLSAAKRIGTLDIMIRELGLMKQIALVTSLNIDISAIPGVLIIMLVKRLKELRCIW